MQRHGRVLLLLTVPLFLAACADVVPQDGGSPLFAKKCNPRREDCTPPPPPGPAEPQLPLLVTDFRSPMRVFETSSGWLLVSDTHQRMVLRVDALTLQPDQGLAVKGQPVGVAMLGDRIYVGDVGTHTVSVYDAQGGPAGTIGGPGAIAAPIDIAVDTVSGLVFVLDAVARGVRVFDASGGEVGQIGGMGLVAPTGLAVDPAAQEVYVADRGDDVVKASVAIFAYDGTFVTSISGAGTCGMMGCTGGFSRPGGLAVRGGRIYLTDQLLAAVLVFDRATKKLLSTVGGRTASPLLRQPTDAALLGGDVIVASKLAGRIERFAGVAP